MQKINLGMAASGSGTTVEQVLRACQDGLLPGIEPVLLITDRPGAGVVERARGMGLTNHRLIDTTFVVSQFVARRFDLGSVVHYKSVPIMDGDTPATLQQRALPWEWRAQIETLWMFASGPVGISDSYYVNPFVRDDEDDLVAEAVRFALSLEP